MTLKVAVLDNGQRIITQSALHKAFGRPLRGSRQGGDQDMAKLPALIDAKNLKPFISSELIDVIKPVNYISISGSESQGLDYSVLPLVCEVYLDAYKATKPDKSPVLQPKQIPNAQAAEKLSRVLMRVSLVALIDEVTGYQDVRMKDALERYLNELLLTAPKAYKVTFPIELYKEWFRLNGWEWKPENAQKRPGVLGTWTNKYIYDRMAPGLRGKLELLNPKDERGNRKHKFFSFLTDDIGEPRLREFFGGLIALAKATTSWKKYVALVEKAYPSFGDQLKLDMDDED